jgi:hypothetical protein
VALLALGSCSMLPKCDKTLEMYWLLAMHCIIYQCESCFNRSRSSIKLRSGRECLEQFRCDSRTRRITIYVLNRNTTTKWNNSRDVLTFPRKGVIKAFPSAAGVPDFIDALSITHRAYRSGIVVSALSALVLHYVADCTRLACLDVEDLSRPLFLRFHSFSCSL